MSVEIVCERCGKVEKVENQAGLFDFQYEHGFTFCEDCMGFWLKSKAVGGMASHKDAYAARGLRA